MDEHSPFNREKPGGRGFPASSYLSALLIALALLGIVVLARSRSEPLAQVGSPLPGPTAVPTRPFAAIQPAATATEAAAPTRIPTLAPTAQPTAPPIPTAVPPITVHIAGAVRKPGVYTLPPRSRVNDALEEAGGFARRADTLAINLAQPLQDAMQIIVPAKPARTAPRPGTKPKPIRTAAAPTPTATPTPAAAKASPSPQPSASDGSEPEPAEQPSDAVAFPVNLNTATQAELEALPGIGPSKARAIIEYRETEGGFGTAEELQEVTGIGPKTWESLRDKVTV